MNAELSLEPLPETKPTDRGKFSPDRDFWEKLHHARYQKWQAGLSVEDAGAEEGVTSNAIRHSIAWCEGHYPKAEVLAARATRLKLMAFSRLTEKYVDETERLMADPSPLVRLRALESFRRTVGLEAGGGVNVNVNQTNQTAVVNRDSVRSFENMLTRVRNSVFSDHDQPA